MVKMRQLFGLLAQHRAATIALASVGITLLVAFVDNLSGWILLPLLALLVFAVASAGLAPSRYELVPVLELIQQSMYRVLELSDGDRLTIHCVTNLAKEEFEQLTEYFPIPARSSRGRRFGFSYGIVGQCIKNNSLKRYSIDPGVSFGDAMRERWNFTEKELAGLTSDRRSFMAIPVGRYGDVAQAVIYFDSRIDQRFTESMGNKVTECFLPQLQELLKRS